MKSWRRNKVKNAIKDAAIAKNIFLLFLVPLLLIMFPEAMAQPTGVASLTVHTDKGSYTAGETIVVSGGVAGVVEGERLLFRLYTPLGALARADPVDVSDNGTYRYQFPTGGPTMSQSGYYKIVVNYNLQEAETSFDLDAGSGPHPWTISIEGDPYQIRYRIDGGNIVAMSGDPDSKSIAVTINAKRDASVMKLQLQFSRSIIQAQNVTTGQDIPFVVLIDGNVANFTEYDTPASGTRELEIPFKQGQSEVKIIGTWMVPEFGPVATLAFAAGVSFILLSNARLIRRLGH
jgi:hypothetical protein